MSEKYPGGVIRSTPVTPAGPYQDSAASGIWTLDQATNFIKQGNWPTAGNVNPSAFIENLFQTWLYTGNGSTQTITNGIDLSTKGGLVWGKDRSGANAHNLYDTARGAAQRLASNLTNAQANTSPAFSSFNSDGFSLNGSSDINNNGNNIVSWTFRKQPKFFDVVTYTGTGSAQNIAHSLGSVPGCIIVKGVSGDFSTGNWAVYHRSLTETTAIQLNNSNPAFTTSSYWNNTAPTSTQFTVGTAAQTGAPNTTYVAYLFAHDAGGFGLTGTDNVISCGSLSGAGTTVNLGYEPQWILAKRTDTTGNWYIDDNMRGWPAAPENDNPLLANSSAAEPTGYAGFANITSTGFTNNFNGDYIYIAIRRGPMKTPTTGTSVFTPAFASSSGTYTAVAGFPVDLDLYKDKSGSTGFTWDRLRGSSVYLQTTSTAAEVSDSNGRFDSNTSFIYNTSGNFSSYINWMFRRAPGFFDEVCWTGNDVAGRNLSHNLGVAPEFIITKARTGSYAWQCWHSSFGNTDLISLNQNHAKQNVSPSSSILNTNGTSYVAPTASVFTVGLSAFINNSSFTYVAYLFASCPGVSKVGSYTGTGALQTINCGFTGGARFVLIKRTDSTGDWFVYDSARGISSGNDPYLLMNSTAAEVTGTNYVDTTSVGFQVTAAAPAGLNANGGSYIFLAIA